jgi:hypothetical protein
MQFYFKIKKVKNSVGLKNTKLLKNLLGKS